jgi:hypothetical protein
MAELIQEFADAVRDARGREYAASVYGEAREGGTWEGWIEFRPLSGVGPALRTARETTQPDRGALEYWATGLEPIYLEGALARAV